MITSIANDSVGAIHLSSEVLTNNYVGNVSLNGAVSLNSLAVASTALVVAVGVAELTPIYVNL